MSVSPRAVYANSESLGISLEPRGPIQDNVLAAKAWHGALRPPPCSGKRSCDACVRTAAQGGLSARGQKLTLAMPPATPVMGRRRTPAPQQTASLFDHLFGTGDRLAPIKTIEPPVIHIASNKTRLTRTKGPSRFTQTGSAVDEEAARNRWE
jgi:hypothetical protein